VEPVVKADAYGHGAVGASRALEAAGADGFCVAAYDEAIELRRAGIRRRILVLYPPDPALAPDAARRRVTLSVGDPELLRRTLAALEGAARARAPRARAPRARAPRLAMELEVETGLGRGGFEPAGIVAAARAIAAQPTARFVGAWTHLQAADDAARTSAQFERFEAALADLQSEGLAPQRRHVVATGGLAVGGLAAYDAIRPGLAVYGIAPDDVDPRFGASLAALRPALALIARPSRVTDLPAGWGVSYGPTFTTRRPSRIATLPVGYGDGYPRHVSNRADALVRGVRAPLVGNVAMDALMVDVTDVPGPPVGVDDEFVLVGRQGAAEIQVLELAQRSGTITWVVLAAMARRLTRVYDAPSGVVGARTLHSPGTTWHESNFGTAISATSRSTRS
jgi:alanine racemase